MVDIPKIVHDIKNDLQVILWGLEAEASEESKLNARKSVTGIVEKLDSIDEQGA